MRAKCFYVLQKIASVFSTLWLCQMPVAATGMKIPCMKQGGINYKDLLESKQVTPLARLMAPST
jgi:hypothetical protein